MSLIQYSLNYSLLANSKDLEWANLFLWLVWWIYPLSYTL